MTTIRLGCSSVWFFCRDGCSRIHPRFNSLWMFRSIRSFLELVDGPSVISFLHPASTSDLSPLTDLAGRAQDSPDAAARGEGLQQLLVLRDPPDRLRGLRLCQRPAVPVASWHWLHLPDQQQRLPLGALCTHKDEMMMMMMWTPLPVPPTHALLPDAPHWWTAETDGQMEAAYPAILSLFQELWDWSCWHFNAYWKTKQNKKYFLP